MPTYQRTHDGHHMTIHAPRGGSGEFDPAAMAADLDGEPILGLDVETRALPDTGPRHFGPDAGLRLVQLGTATVAWVLDPLDPAQRAAIAAVLGDPGRRFVTHTSFDTLAVWSALAIGLGQRVADTHLISKLVDPDERAGHGLKTLTARHLDDGLTLAQTALYARMRALAPPGERAGERWKTWGWAHLPADDEAYVVYVRRLLPVLLDLCGPFSHLVPVEQWLAAQSVGITIRGLALDLPYTRAYLAQVEADHHAAAALIEAELGCPPTSPRFADWLDTQHVPGPRTATGRLQVTADTLTALARDLDTGRLTVSDQVRRMLTARGRVAATSNTIANLRSFLAAADPAGRVHPQINTLRAKTGRMSITGPALQTLKKGDPRLRHCFQADPGHVLISCDFSQVEVRVTAALSRDPALTDVLASGVDIHDATARLLFGDGFTKDQRTLAKRATFGTIYGGGARALMNATGATHQVATDVITRWRAAYPGVAAYSARLADHNPVITGSGRRIPADPLRPYANANYAVQSTARDLLVTAVHTLVTRHGLHDALWLFVHDEVIVHVPTDRAAQVAADLQAAMTTSFRGVAITAEADILGTHWGPLPDTDPAGRAA
ncbi:DNA polymerase [Candidatus Protofrankia datiscae]|uniref:DNA polymerase I n=1 Tax=Candidatus Protofrankia datiscae TaxID=2716812 RepID=F8B491_9ACTN|nr:DNA polymerase [Candidatus Protofrankia datiscae]AEH11007.1 DNA-directed DNA polymerase [Candidatus Protofrankia datiscae]